MALLLRRAGYEATMEANEADVVIVNTCGFIDPARQETLEILRSLTEGYPERKVIAAGCWAQREPEKLLELVPELDAVIGTRSWHEIVPLVSEVMQERKDTVYTLIEERPVVTPEEAGAPGYVISGPSAFLKIADGCSRRCAFCAIPSIKGAAVSRSPEAILKDARELQKMGILEINLIAQDASYYGYDMGQRDGLAALLERMVDEIPDVPWLRLLYTFPGYVTERLIEAMASHDRILPYVDIPLQHAHPDTLHRMHRPADVDWVRETIEKLRERMPEVALRSAFIVGFPGETEEEFLTLLDFVNEVRFDRVGVFTYSHEQGTVAGKMEDDVPQEVKEERREALMVAQQAISYQQNLSFVGHTLDVLLEGQGDDLTVGRSYRDAPEIDGLVLISEEVEPHRLVKVRIIEALTYDLMGKIEEEGKN